jgi:SHS2 domain-containing protein
MGRPGTEGGSGHPGEPLRQGPTPGVTGLDHTADLGIRVRAGSLAELLDRAARGMLELALGEHDAPAAGPAAQRTLDLEADDAPILLVAWLREILFLFQVRDFLYRSADFETLTEERLVATLHGTDAPAERATEIKGVTYHGLEVREHDGVWRATIIFDV